MTHKNNPTVPIPLPNQSQNAKQINLPQQVSDETKISSQNVVKAEEYLDKLKCMKNSDQSKPSIDDLCNAIEYKHKINSNRSQNSEITAWAKSISEKLDNLTREVKEQGLFQKRVLDMSKNRLISVDSDGITPLVGPNGSYPQGNFPTTKGNLRKLTTKDIEPILDFYYISYNENTSLDNKRKDLATFLGFSL